MKEKSLDHSNTLNYIQVIKQLNAKDINTSNTILDAKKYGETIDINNKRL